MREGDARRLRSGPRAVRVLLYRYRPGDYGRGGRRELLETTRRTRVDVEDLHGRLSPGRYRLEWRSERGRVVRVRAFAVRRGPSSPHGADESARHSTPERDGEHAVPAAGLATAATSDASDVWSARAASASPAPTPAPLSSITTSAPRGAPSLRDEGRHHGRSKGAPENHDPSVARLLSEFHTLLAQLQRR